MHRPVLLLVVLACAAPALPRADGAADDPRQALRADRSLKVRTQAAFALGQRGDPAAVPALRAALEQDPAAAVRIAAISALGRLGGAEARAAVEAAGRRDADREVRAAAARTLVDWSGAAGVVAFTIEEPAGSAGGAPARAALRDAIARHLRARGFSVLDEGGVRLKPSVIRVDVESAAGNTVVAVRASLVAVDGQGRMAAMLESGARLSAHGNVPEARLAAYSAQALDAVARSLCEDLAARLR